VLGTEKGLRLGFLTKGARAGQGEPLPKKNGELSMSMVRDMLLLMYAVHQTEEYATWFASLRDRTAKSRINVRIRRAALGNLGDVKPVGEGVSEMRINHGPGYRIYLVLRGRKVIVLLAGGSKRTQGRDIKRALELARNI
jgi:putative addiction module killer protein